MEFFFFGFRKVVQTYDTNDSMVKKETAATVVTVTAAKYEISERNEC